MSKLSLKPKRAIPNNYQTKSAWWYDEKGAISVYIELFSGEVVSAKIRRSALLDYIARSGKP